MELGQAKAIVQNMKAKYAAFERLEAVIAAVEQAQGLHSERAAALDALETKIKERTLELHEVTNQCALMQGKKVEAEHNYAKKSRELDDTFQTQRQTIANDIKHAERQADLTKSTLRDEIAALQLERKALQDNLDSLRSQIAAIRQSLNIPNT